MKGAKSLDEYVIYWGDYLSLLEKSWNKVLAQCNGVEKFKYYKGLIEHKRKTDPLLRYLKQARNADQHTIQEIAKAKGRIPLNPTGSGSFSYLMITKDGRLMSDAQNIEFKLIDPSMHAANIVNKSVQYEVPTTHLGDKIEDNTNPLVLAKLGLKYYNSEILKIESAF